VGNRNKGGRVVTAIEKVILSVRKGEGENPGKFWGKITGKNQLNNLIQTTKSAQIRENSCGRVPDFYPLSPQAQAHAAWGGGRRSGCGGSFATRATGCRCKHPTKFYGDILTSRRANGGKIKMKRLKGTVYTKSQTTSKLGGTNLRVRKVGGRDRGKDEKLGSAD